MSKPTYHGCSSLPWIKRGATLIELSIVLSLLLIPLGATLHVFSQQIDVGSIIVEPSEEEVDGGEAPFIFDIIREVDDFINNYPGQPLIYLSGDRYYIYFSYIYDYIARVGSWRLVQASSWPRGHLIYDYGSNIYGVLKEAHPWGHMMLPYAFNPDIMVLRYAHIPKYVAELWGQQRVQLLKDSGRFAAYAIGMEEVYGQQPNPNDTGLESSGITHFGGRIGALFNASVVPSNTYYSSGDPAEAYFIPATRARTKFPHVRNIHDSAEDFLPQDSFLTYVDVAFCIQADCAEL